MRIAIISRASTCRVYRRTFPTREQAERFADACREREERYSFGPRNLRVEIVLSR